MQNQMTGPSTENKVAVDFLALSRSFISLFLQDGGDISEEGAERTQESE